VLGLLGPNGSGKTTTVSILSKGNRARIPNQMQSALADSHPLRRLGTPQDVADAAAYLASGEAAWVTGVVLDVAGGAVMV
jgi:3-oxoacyl-[acyl-carrier protein] reductase